MITPGTPRLVKVYKTARKRDMYLYVDFSEDLARVPETLLARFGSPELVLTLKLEPAKKLARADAREVLAGIRDSGFYLQMPPPEGGVDAQIEGAVRLRESEGDAEPAGGKPCAEA